jgi:hypothetical protein
VEDLQRELAAVKAELAELHTRWATNSDPESKRGNDALRRKGAPDQVSAI